MKTSRTAGWSCAVTLLVAGCGRETAVTAETVIIVDGSRAKWRGAADEISDLRMGADGEFAPWVEGAIVIFRSDGTYFGHAGDAGRVYRITGEELDPAGKIDLEKSDDELAEEFGVRPTETPSSPGT